MNKVKHISIYINRSPHETYEYASNPEYLSNWASGLAQADIVRDGDEWVAKAPFGEARISFAEPNSFGVMDHDVKMESGVTVHNAMRVIPNGNGSEFLFSLFLRPGMSEEEFENDARHIKRDLEKLKEILENQG
ncbi:SRPBCC family protein [Cellvibrio sp. PSBB006]|uniref:SRPBCC family protein n=1 Tax=Cellvibrio sp. PSBB006 TaxID=1987723 RepID=UPI000B3B3729|nr:SRPBCC family protein [Cellvibrio sp. PSBB006]ARU28173.1 polyketide cyclase [Cellvibrio sp. PSBB006]